MPHEFGAIKITGFLALTPNVNRFSNAKGEWMKLIGHQSLNKEESLSVSVTPSLPFKNVMIEFLFCAVNTFDMNCLELLSLSVFHLIYLDKLKQNYYFA